MAVAAKQNRRRSSEQRKRLAWLTEAQAALGWGLILGLLALLGAIYLHQTSRIATVGRRVQQLQIQLDDVKRDNAAIERDIAEAQSLERLQAEAVRLGFVQAGPDDVEFLAIPDYPPDPGPRTEPESAATPEPVETMREAIWLALRASIGDLTRGESR